MVTSGLPTILFFRPLDKNEPSVRDALFSPVFVTRRFLRGRLRVVHAAAVEASGSGETSALEKFLIPGSRASMAVPVPLETISKSPPSCRILSLMPLIPTPGVPPDTISSRFSGDMPLPSSSTSTRT